MSFLFHRDVGDSTHDLNPISKTKILSVEYLTVSFSLLDTTIDQPSVRFHLPAASSILAHLRPIVGKL